MAKFMIKARYAADGAKGLLAHGGTPRRTAVEKACSTVGGSLESFYFAFGGTDVYAVADLPSNEAAAALALSVGASGAVGAETVVLLTCEELDAASQLTVDYSPPKA